jgi:hypothetical protein
MTNKRAAILAEADALEIAGRQAFADLIAEMNRHRALDISARLWPPSERCETIEIAEQLQQPFLCSQTKLRRAGSDCIFPLSI